MFYNKNKYLPGRNVHNYYYPIKFFNINKYILFKN